jgi:hypothetical protein
MPDYMKDKMKRISNLQQTNPLSCQPYEKIIKKHESLFAITEKTPMIHWIIGIFLDFMGNRYR